MDNAVQSPADLESAAVERRCGFYDGQRIFAEGQLSDFAYIVVSGQVELLKSHPDGDLQLALLGPGELFGEMGLLDGAVRSASGVARGETVLRALDKDELLLLLQTQPETTINLVSVISKRLRRAYSLIGQPELVRAKQHGIPWRARLRDFLKPREVDLDRVLIEFQPDAIEIEEQPVPHAAKAILYTILGLVLVGTVWASLATVDRIVVANGKVTTSAAKIVLQPLATATIRAVHVRPGQLVEKDQVLVSLDPTFTGADERSVRAQMQSASAEIRRLEAELAPPSNDTAPPAPFSDDPDEQQAQAKTFAHRRTARASMIASAETEIKEIEAHAATLRADQRNLEVDIETLRRVEAVRQELHSRGNGSLLDLLDAQRKLGADRRELERMTNELGEGAGKIETVRAKLKSSLDEMNSRAAQELQTARREFAKAAQQMMKQERLSALIDLRSPAKAAVVELSTRSVGSVVKEGEEIVSLVPTDVPFEIEAIVETKDIAQVRLDDVVRIKLEAFPYQKYGTLDGRVAMITGDAVDHEEAGRKIKVFKIRAQVTKSNLRDVPRDVALLPGMAATAEIKVGSRRLITYFLYPIIRTLDSSLRDP